MPSGGPMFTHVKNPGTPNARVACPQCGTDMRPGGPCPYCAPHAWWSRRHDVTVWLVVAVIAVFLIIAFGNDSGTSSYVPADAPHGTYKDVQIGMNFDQVKFIMGPPSNTQEFRSRYSWDDNWYYGGAVQVCFENGRVTAVNRY